ncbi:MAG: MFS transporter [Candidatus Berkelbacteria bacterium]|nr:MFS transporter [Candidatus Berkelbacteria bacterium]
MKLINDNNRKWWTLGTVCFALLMIVLDGNVVNLAIPSIMKTFNAGMSDMEWVNNAYLLTFAIFLITFGRLGDELGRKRFFIGGLIFFVVGSFLCGLAGNANQLVLFRVVQGLGGAAMMPATLSLIAANFEKRERGMAMGLWGAVSGLGIVLGPILGGYLTDKGLPSLNGILHISQYWRYVFYINIPIGIIAVLLSFFVIRESMDHEKTHKFDFLGILFSSLSIFLLTYGFIEGAKYGWWKSNEAFSLLGHNIHFGSISVIPFIFLLAVILLAVFIYVERFCHKDPLVDLKLFKARNFSVGSFAAAVLSFAMMGSFFLLPLFLQIVMGFAPIKTGTILLPFALTIMILAPISGRLADRIGGKYLIVAGMAIMALGGFYIGHFRVDTQIRDLILPFIVMGIGMGLSMPPLNNITLLETPEDEIGGASGVLSTARQIGSVMGIAILGAFLQTTLAAKLDANLKAASAIPTPVQAKILEIAKSSNGLTGNVDWQKEFAPLVPSAPSYQIPDSVAKTMPVVELEQRQKALAAIQTATREYAETLMTNVNAVVKKSFVDSINRTFHLAALIALFGAIISLLFRGGRLKDDDEDIDVI